MQWVTLTWMHEYIPWFDYFKHQLNKKGVTFLKMRNYGVINNKFTKNDDIYEYVEDDKIETYSEICKFNIIPEKMIIDKSSESILWRTYSNKMKNFRICYIKKNDRLAAYALVKDRTNDRGFKESIICDWGLLEKNEASFNVLIKKIRETADCISIKVSENDDDFILIKKLKFFERKKAKQPVIAKSLTNKTDLSVGGKWIPRAIDYDSIMF
jgi:hypothetical protein